MRTPPAPPSRTDGSGPRRRPRLLAVSHTGLVSGAETVLHRVARMAVEAGWQVEVATPPGPFAERLRADGMAVVDLPDLKPGAGPEAVALAAWGVRAARAAAVLRRAAAGADAVVVNGLLALPAVRMARLAGMRAPVAWLVHDVVWQPRWQALLRRVRSAVDVAWAVSDAVADPLRGQGVATTVVRNGTRWPVEPGPPERPTPPVVGCAAMLTSWKGQDVLLDAVARLAERGHDDVVVELAGGTFPKDGPYVERLRARAARPDLVGRVRFLGNLDDAPARVRTWTVAVLPSVDPEAAPLALLEYLSVGTPAVVTDHGGSPEVLGDAGLLVPPRDPDALADALATLLDEPVRWRACAAAGPQLVADGLTLEHQRVAVLAALDDLRRDVAAPVPVPATADAPRS